MNDPFLLGGHNNSNHWSFHGHKRGVWVLLNLSKNGKQFGYTNGFSTSLSVR